MYLYISNIRCVYPMRIIIRKRKSTPFHPPNRPLKIYSVYFPLKCWPSIYFPLLSIAPNRQFLISLRCGKTLLSSYPILCYSISSENGQLWNPEIWRWSQSPEFSAPPHMPLQFVYFSAAEDIFVRQPVPSWQLMGCGNLHRRALSIPPNGKGQLFTLRMCWKMRLTFISNVFRCLMIACCYCRYLSWDDYFMAIAFLSAERSKDPNRQVISFVYESVTVCSH